MGSREKEIPDATQCCKSLRGNIDVMSSTGPFAKVLGCSCIAYSIRLLATKSSVSATGMAHIEARRAFCVWRCGFGIGIGTGVTIHVRHEAMMNA